jgi:hypothetical protein
LKLASKSAEMKNPKAAKAASWDLCWRLLLWDGPTERRAILLKSEIRDQRSEIRDQKSEIRNQRSEIRDQRSEIRDQRSEIRNQRSEIRDQKSGTQNPESFVTLTVLMQRFE